MALSRNARVRKPAGLLAKTTEAPSPTAVTASKTGSIEMSSRASPMPRMFIIPLAPPVIMSRSTISSPMIRLNAIVASAR